MISIVKASAIWLVMVVFAILNGIIREKVLVPNVGQVLALPISGIALSILVFLIVYISIPFFGDCPNRTFVYLGLQWVFMTLLFEFIFGHYVAGQSWDALLQVFNVLDGNLFSLVLLTTLLSPWIAAKLRGTSYIKIR